MIELGPQTRVGKKKYTKIRHNHIDSIMYPNTYWWVKIITYNLVKSEFWGENKGKNKEWKWVC